MKKHIKTILIGSLILCSSAALLWGADNRFSDFSKQVLAITAKPGYHIENNRLLIIHPMVKDREIILVHNSQLTWKGNTCKRKIVSSRQIKGKKAKGNIVGKTVPFHYIPEELKELLTSARIRDWQKTTTMKLDKQPCPGYSFNATMKGVTRKSALFLNSRGGLKAISFGFPEKGISHAKNMTDSGITWYFEHSRNKMFLVKTVTVTAQKKNGIPIIKIITEMYNRF